MSWDRRFTEFFYQKLPAYTTELPSLSVLVASNPLLTSLLIPPFGLQKARNLTPVLLNMKFDTKAL